jgi:5-formyltetrahydrofolate cyclo-ligase
MTVLADKAAWRARLYAARTALPPERLAAAADALRGHLLPRLAAARRVAAYVPTGPEPGSLDLLDDLLERGTTVLLPVVRDDAGLDWAVYAGRSELVRGRLGMLEPTGRRRSGGTVTEADILLVPALAADHTGTRLGRGAGYYDRALAGVQAGTPVVALLHDGELVPRLPGDRWDRPVTAVSTPALGWTELPFTAHNRAHET